MSFSIKAQIAGKNRVIICTDLSTASFSRNSSIDEKKSSSLLLIILVFPSCFAPSMLASSLLYSYSVSLSLSIFVIREKDGEDLREKKQNKNTSHFSFVICFSLFLKFYFHQSTHLSVTEICLFTESPFALLEPLSASVTNPSLTYGTGDGSDPGPHYSLQYRHMNE